ncbi:hypothetical protein EDB92DRAFT_348921 [Lactarius akahatsu]|uniref:Uncharacterized protein n=1 Tax=Lactarius akahatsu TaxID=416441 RepID=A0AAD4QEQ8_9AGAM|nr:hypothetical protein EDB92DRAFT_348921 [Lactarius akahatsu]
MHPRRLDKPCPLQRNTTLALGNPGGMAQSRRSTMGTSRIRHQRPIVVPSPNAKTLVLLLPICITRATKRTNPRPLYARVRRVELRKSTTAPIVSRFVPPKRICARPFELERVLSKLRANKVPEQRGAAQDLLVRAGTAGRLGWCVDPEASAPQESGNGKRAFFRRPRADIMVHSETRPRCTGNHGGLVPRMQRDAVPRDCVW